MQKDLGNATWLVCNADVLFNSACVNLHRMAILFLVVSLLTALGGLGAAFCPKEFELLSPKRREIPASRLPLFGAAPQALKPTFRRL